MTTSDTDPVARLRDLLAGTAKPKARPGSKSGTKSRAYNAHPEGRSSRLLTGVALRAAARKSAGKELSPLENNLLSMFKIWATDDVVADLGKEFTGHSKARGVSQPVFPEAVLQLHDDEPYTRKHLLRDTRKLAPEIAARPENQVVNVQSIMSGNIDSDEYKAVLGRTGAGVTMFTGGPAKLRRDIPTESEVQDAANSGSAPPEQNKVEVDKEASAKVQSTNGAKSTSIEVPLELVFDRMNCIRDQEGETGTDEIYVCWGAGSDGKELANGKSREYEDIVADKTTYFDSGTKLFASTFHLSFNAHIEVWESDHSNDEEYDRMLATLHEVAMNLHEAAVEGMESEEGSEGAAVVALLACILDLVGVLLEVFRNMDDFLCRRTLAFDRAAINALYNSTRDLPVYFPGSTDEWGDFTGTHVVHLKAVGAAPPCGAVMASKVAMTGKTGSYEDFTVSPRERLSVNGKYGMGLACFKNQMVAVWGRENEGSAMCMTAPISADIGSWSSADNFRDNKITSRPALAVVGSKLHLCFRPVDNVVRWFWTTDLKSWSSQVKMAQAVKSDTNASFDVATEGSVTAAGFRGQLFMMTCLAGPTSYLLVAKQNPDSETPAKWHMLSRSSDYGPGLVVFQDSLYCFYVDYENTISVLKYDPEHDTWGLWSFAPFGVDVYSSLSCSTTDSAILIAYRDIKGNPTICSLTNIASRTAYAKIKVLADTQGVGDPTVCAVDGYPDSVLTTWVAAYEN